MFIEDVSVAVREVGMAEVVPRFRSLAEGDVTEKSPGDLVTIADQECERVLGERLRSIREIPVVGEEGTSADPSLLDLVAPGDGQHGLLAATPQVWDKVAAEIQSAVTP